MGDTSKSRPIRDDLAPLKDHRNCGWSQDQSYCFEDLGNAVRKVRVDLGIPIEFQSGLPIYASQDVRNRYCAVGRFSTIAWMEKTIKGVDLEGTIIYIKACLNGSEPADGVALCRFGA